MKRLSIALSLLLLPFGVVIASTGYIASKSNGLNFVESGVSSQWASQLNNYPPKAHFKEWGGAYSTHFPLVNNQDTSTIGDVGLCVSGKHVATDTPNCSYVFDTTKGYGIGLSKGTGTIGISVAVIIVKGNIGSGPSLYALPIQIKPIDTSCYQFSNQGYNLTNWWEHKIDSWEDSQTKVFYATINIEGSGSKDDPYYAGLSGCSISS